MKEAPEIRGARDGREAARGAWREVDGRPAPMKTFTPAEIRDLLPKVRHAADETEFDIPLNQAADALEYLLQFVEWKRIRDEKPFDPEQEVIIAYYDSFTTANLDGGKWNALECSYPEIAFDLWLPFVLPPPQAGERKEDAA